MTEYTTSSQAVREYMSSRERTAYWVQSHEETDFYSPSAPPSTLDKWVPSSPASEAESSHSLPPRMVLRWGNGVPDVPIPNTAESHRSGRSRRRREGSGSRSSASPAGSPTSSNFPHHRARSGSHPSPSSPLAHSGSYHSNHYQGYAPPAPEEIRVLPSHGPPQPHSSSSQPRSKSLPRSAELSSHGMPGPMPRTRTPYPHAPGQGPPLPAAATQQAPFAPQPWQPYTQGRPPHHTQKHPPAIIYAPSHTSSRPRYAPPAMYHYPPQIGPNGMIYSHSAPVHSAPHPAHGAGLPSTMVPPSHTLAQVREEEQRAGTWSGRSNKRAYNQTRSLSLVPPPLSPSSSSSSLNSAESGSTYYVLPSAGQKVLVISPSPEPSIGIATSTTRSPTSPHSFKKAPFLQRLFNFAGKFSSSASSKASSASGSRRLQRRHSTSGAAHRPEVNRR